MSAEEDTGKITELMFPGEPGIEKNKSSISKAAQFRVVLPWIWFPQMRKNN